MTSSDAHPAYDKTIGRPALPAWRRAVYNLLSAAPSLATATSRQMVDVYLPPALRPPAPVSALRRDEFVTALVRLCADRPENAEALIDVMTALEGDAPHVRQLRMLCDQRLAQTRFPEADFEQLRTLVERVTVEDVQGIAAASTEPLPAALPEYCDDAWSILLHLLRRNIPMHGIPPFMSFLEYLAAAAPVAEGNGIREWTWALAQKSGRVVELEDCRLMAGRSVGRPGTEDGRRLMFVLMPDGLEDDVYVLGLWRSDGRNHPPDLRDSGMRLRRDDIAREVSERFAAALGATRGRRTTKLTVEFWLPMALVNEPVWTWCRVDQSAASADEEYTVVVRSLDRLQSPQWSTSLRQHWVVTADAMEQGQDQAVVPAVRAAAVTERARCVVLSEPPDKSQGKRELMAALDVGVPAILWNRFGNSPALLRRARAVVAECSLEDIPLHIGRLQREAGVRRDAQVALLWDTPDHTLPTLNPLVTPDEAAAP
ncbi:hypothetical protein ABT040_15995 [Streptomyces sp. NPDC002688]|uniref:VMAP-C domain-containing protein n=1 Tax=Streptomyces sp. NPDC002688 TaxID=3154423 RepID=UPI003331E487